MADIRVTKVRDVSPDPSIVQAIGRHHTLETAVADLVDNSLDAAASHVTVRFLQRGGAITGLQVIDNGKGMDGAQIDAAMEYARKRDYAKHDQGHFGLGLKAASLSQAQQLNVYSKRYGAVAAGRTISGVYPTQIGELDSEAVDLVLREIAADFEHNPGTVVEWVKPHTFLSNTDPDERARWLENRISSLKAHLGVIFHRLIDSRQFGISIDVFDIDSSESGAPRRVAAIDPFGYTPLPNDGFPSPLTFEIDGSKFFGTAHLWPASQAGRPEFRIGGRNGSRIQGFYFYRNNRLLQVGGWNSLTVERPALEYVRIAIDLNDQLSQHVAINPEKSGLELTADVRLALLEAKIDFEEMSLSRFLTTADSRRRDSRRYIKRPVKLVYPERGVSAAMREAFEESAEASDAPPIRVRWSIEDSESPVRVDLEHRTLWLNSTYRELIAAGDAGNNDDASFVKTLLVLHYARYFEGAYLGSRERAELETWDQLLTAAVRDDSARQAKELRFDDA
ncbi:ATP-binding protein [Pseudoclavibacter helvolus]|uniref:ATP-binding protein n=1 Tax=Pseudoclavibacter helvolus TaxID=255205 RepID=UPI0008382BE8|nr:ATP-binding protein [Pseudoclavibacter helvolus]